MWRTVTPSALAAGWACVCLAAAGAAAAAAASEVPELQLYKKVGDDVVLKPGAPPGTIANVLWKDGPNIAVLWDGGDVDRYRQFRDRGDLNVSSGELTITGLTQNDSDVYTAEINGEVASRTRLIVILPVPTPTIVKVCDEELTSCTLTCDGDTAGVEPLTYSWKSGDTPLPGPAKERHITKEDSAGVVEFSCELENPVSRGSSQPIPNPLTAARERNPESGNPNVSTGVAVFFCLLAAVLLLGFVHRWKAGMWFFQKASMPWEADFWRKDERPQRPASGNAHPAEKGPVDEETLMS